ncbi:MAG: 30S ribosomal protein S8 [Bacilli bacterium]|jgi:small subunit ribosomal protein S8|nr:30S ribosomal protein S8 [Acholeplasmataceae bacterium]
MVMTDPIADMLTRIRNANQARHEKVLIPASRLKMDILKVLQDEGYISGFEKIEDDKQGLISVTLKYNNKERVIKGLKRISKPGLRVYAKTNELPKVLNGLGIAVISTSSGVMTDREARQKKLGGEVLAFVW